MTWLLRLLGWDSYQGFVARRYLLVRESKIKPSVRFAIMALLLARMMLVPVGLLSKSYVLRGLDHIVEGVFLVVLIFGVMRHSRIALWAFIVGLVIGGVGSVLSSISTEHAHALVSPIYDGPGVPAWFGTAALIIAGIGGLITFLAAFFGTLRGGFTFFTTVPIGGVWIGTMALVCVLSVMSGFEADLRNKILGSNAHIQVTREDGDITEWRGVKATIDKVAGVVASTPYAQSEVVIAANNNGQPVIIKGIDPKTVGKVTQLVADLRDVDKPAALQRLEPLIDDSHDLGVTGSAAAPASPDTPIDFSQPAPVGSDVGSAGSAQVAAPTAGAGSGSAFKRYELLGGSDALGGAFGSGFGSDDAAMHIPIDASFDAPSMSRRTQALPGILCGAELEKQMHIYQGEEVRVVSPLSDPSNPDATGTPIPFNRDYRIAGFFFTGMYEYDLKYVYVSLDSFQEFLDRGDSIDGIEVRITNPDDTEVADRIQTALGPSYSVKTWKELNRSLFSALKLEKIAMFVVLGIVILVASFSIVGNLIMVVVEKQREIALLKTLGASDAGVMQLFAIQGLLIGLIGTTLGVLFGLGACYLGKHYGIPLNPNVYYIDRMPVNVDASSVIVTYLAGVVISIAATFYPALLAAQIRPAAGIRH